MNINQRINAFVQLGTFLSQFICREEPQIDNPLNEKYYNQFDRLIQDISIENRWFTTEHVRYSLKGISHFLKRESLEAWTQEYTIENENSGKCIAVIMAGNIPMVGFHDMLCTLMAGHKFLGKLSSKDNQLLDFISQLLCSIEPSFKELITFVHTPLGGNTCFDAIIATGSDNSARYFEAYFSKYPHIIRRNRNAVAILTGNESKDELQALGKDVFLYFGLGCRNVSKLYVPKGYSFEKLLDSWQSFDTIIEHNKYANNYDYNKSIFLMNKTHHLDNGFVLLKEDTAFASPIGVVFYQYYSDIDTIEQLITREQERIQCLVGTPGTINKIIPFGQAQEPGLMDYADNVDTMHFLTRLT